MKKLLIAAALLPLTSNIALANENIYMTGGLAYGDLSLEASDNVYVNLSQALLETTVGYHINNSLSVEAGLGLGVSGDEFDTGIAPVEFSVKNQLSVMARYDFLLDGPLSPYGKLGVSRTDIEVEAADQSESEDAVDLVWAAGLSYTLDPSKSFYIEYNQVRGIGTELTEGEDLDLNTLRFGINITF